MGLALAATGLAVPATAHADVTVYRCTAAGGAVTLQDTPCADGARQEVRTLQRPQDPPPRAADPAVSVPAPVVDATPPPQVVRVHAPQPMYECITPDGERYTSDRGDGNPRFVPFWTGGGPRRGPARPPGIGTRGDTRAPSSGLSTVPGAGLSTVPSRGLSTVPVGGPGTPPPVSIPSRPGPGPGHGHPHGYGYGYGGGTWIQDSCSPLPQAEVCSRLSDRRDTLRRRFFNAQESERSRLRGEERTLNARLAEDCEI